MNRIEFSLKEYRPDWGKWHGVVPLVDGVSLVTHVRDYEAAQGFDLPGCYGGIEPSSENRGRWVRYLLGEAYPEDDGPSNGITWLLGCSCSVAGCWPLEARVTVERDRVTWNGFANPTDRSRTIRHWPVRLCPRRIRTGARGLGSKSGHRPRAVS